MEQEGKAQARSPAVTGSQNEQWWLKQQGDLSWVIWPCWMQIWGEFTWWAFMPVCLYRWDSTWVTDTGRWQCPQMAQPALEVGACCRLVEFVVGCAVMKKPADPCAPHPSNLKWGVLEEYSDADLTVTDTVPGHREIKWLAQEICAGWGNTCWSPELQFQPRTSPRPSWAAGISCPWQGEFNRLMLVLW